MSCKKIIVSFISALPCVGRQVNVLLAEVVLVALVVVTMVAPVAECKRKQTTSKLSFTSTGYIDVSMVINKSNYTL